LGGWANLVLGVYIEAETDYEVGELEARMTELEQSREKRKNGRAYA